MVDTSDMLSLRVVGEAIGVSESTIRRWADEGLLVVTRTAGGHRRVWRKDAIRFIRQARCAVVRPELLGITGLDRDIQVSIDSHTQTQLLVEALKKGDSVIVRSVLMQAYLSGASVARLADTLIRESMHAMGQLWKHDETGIFVEHRATDLCVQAVQEIRSLQSQPGAEAPVALGCAPSGDSYVLPTMLAGMVLQEAGFAGVNLGPETPLRTLLHAMDATEPRLVWMSCSVTGMAGRLKGELEELVRWAGQRGIRVVVGGRGVPEPAALEAMGVLYVESMGELAGLGRGMREIDK